MKVHYIYGRSYDSNIYVINGKNPTIIDTGTGLYNDIVATEIKKILNPKEIKQIILTHEHYDHCGGVKKISELNGSVARVFAHNKAADKIENGDSYFARMLGGQMPKMPVDIKLEDSDKIVIGDENFEVLYTPGHTPGCICLYSKESKTLFSGDTVFSHGSFGRYDFPGGNPHDLRKSIEKLANFDIINLYPGHDTIVEGEGNRHISLTLKNTEYLK